MFPQTITLTIATVPYVLNRVNQDGYGSEYRYRGSSDAISMKIRHSKDSPDGDLITMERHNVFIEHIVYPTPTTAMVKSTFTCTIRGGSFQDPATSSSLAKGAIAWLDSGTVLTDLGVGVN